MLPPPPLISLNIYYSRHHQNFYQQPPHNDLQILHCKGLGRNSEDTDKRQRKCVLSEKRYIRYREPADQLGYFCHSYYELSQFQDEEKNGAGERTSGTTPGAEVFAECVQANREPASSFVEASLNHKKEIAKDKESSQKKTGG